MNHSTLTETENTTPVGSHKGFIAFCETNLRYEKGLKAWIILGPYLLGAFVLEAIINSSQGTFTTRIALWIGFLAYLTLFPELWRRVLRKRNSAKALIRAECSPTPR